MKKFFLMAFFAAMLLSAASCSSPKEDTFTLWQLPSQVNTIGNSYVIQTVNGKVIVMDGGSKEETSYLRGFISALGAEVEAWFISHPHDDHFEALLEILRDPQDIKINRIYHSRFTLELIELEQGYWNAETKEIYGIFDNATDFEVFDCHAGDEFQIDGINFKILSEKNPEMLTSYNDHSMVIKMWDDVKSFVFLGDLGPEGGRKLMESEYMKDVDCDYLQMAHHGQDGCDKEFYMRAKFRACLWPSPTWVYNNDTGGGFNTGHLKTIEVRDWMKEKGITEHYVSNEGLVKIK